MKIGIDGRLWSQTGVGRYLQQLVSNLAKIDKENYYILFLRQKEQHDLPLPGSTWKKVVVDIRWHSLKEQIFMPFILWREHLDLIHFPYFSVPIFFPGKFVVTIHDLILDHFDTGQASTLPWPIYKIKYLGYKLVMWITLHRAQKVITVSKTTKKEIIDHYRIDAEKIVVTYEAALDDETLGVKGIPPPRCKKPYLLYVGNAYPHKNLERLIKAFFKLKTPARGEARQGWQNLKLILVGSEDFFYRRLVNYVKKLRLTDEVIFWGKADRQELISLYKNAIVLVFPSLMEGFGLPAVEALACGCLVLASDIPVFHEILGDAVIYFNPYDVSDMVGKMKDVLENPRKYEIFKKRGLAQVKKYSWSKLASQTLKVYED